METVVIEGEVVKAVSPEGQTVVMPLAEVLAALAPRRFDSLGVILPDGVKSLVPTRSGFVVVHETPPRVWNLRWIADQSPPFGRQAEYRDVRLALPYVVVLATFDGDARGRAGLTGWNECFFRNAPLKGLDDELCYPALLNCSKMDGAAKRPLVWICTQHLNRRKLAGDAEGTGARVRASLRGLLHHLMETGFNRSSEHHEGASWWSETVKAKVDPRLASVEAWQEASRADPLFALDVPWLPVQRTLRQVLDRIVAAHRGNGHPASARDLARFLFNHAS